ncbi:unnamed protein product [Adineta ricciae]|uniref:Uncharacterized protein n=1 Tax=Adineta ricciae TaxID=249248 RepID=A0A816B7M7_ADIRI|nr:unnamed protein product [Adineta ricciae]CAF1607277.1 unnamed protein product [Adineta ricciae]
MLVTIFLLFALALCDVSSLKCYKCDETHVNFWINAKTLPSFPTNCSSVEAEKQCTAVVRWFTLPNGKESYVDYLDNFYPYFLPKDSSRFFVFVAIERELRTASTRALVYSCTTDNCNNETSLQRALSSLTLKENFAPLDVLFSNNTKKFTQQSSCIEFSNSTHIECPSSASPLSLCPACVLLEVDGPSRELCARCPNESTTTDVDSVERRVFFFPGNKTRLGDQSTLVCRTKGCNALDNAEKIHQLSTIEFDFKEFFP